MIRVSRGTRILVVEVAAVQQERIPVAHLLQAATVVPVLLSFAIKPARCMLRVVRLPQAVRTRFIRSPRQPPLRCLVLRQHLSVRRRQSRRQVQHPRR